MALTTISGISILAMCSAIPKRVVENTDIAGHTPQELERIVTSTGIRQRHVVTKGQTALNLAQRACEDILSNIPDLADDIGLVIFVTQTPDYAFPGNAVQLQDHLGLSKATLAFDVNLGCSGFVYGLWQAAQLLSGLPCKYALLVSGDTTSTQYSENNSNVNTLFGDAVCATLLARNHNAEPMYFDLGSDGSGAPYLIQANGAAKHPEQAPELFMEGTQVFAFTLREVPKSINACLLHAQLTIADLDMVVLHQANQMMLKHLGDKLKIPTDKLIIALQDCGNTSSASIPLAMTMEIGEKLSTRNSASTQKPLTFLLSGFGVGWSWGSCIVSISDLRLCKTLVCA